MSVRSRPVAIVTGGRRGIGLGIARALAEAGFDLALTGPDEGKETAPALEALQALGAEAIYLRSDIAQLGGHAGAVRGILDHFGAIDVLVNNAGIGSPVRGDFLDLPPESFDAVIGTNLRGTVFFTQAVVRAMLGAKAAPHPRSIVNITSVSATLSSPERLDYCMSKAGLAAFTQGLALRLAETGVSAFEVRPGIIRSAMTAAVSARYEALIGDGLVPMRRWGEPEDVGRIVAALASGEFGFATGSVVNADGALSIGRL